MKEEILINPLKIPTKRYSPTRDLHYITSEHNSDSDRIIYFQCIHPNCKAGVYSKNSVVLKKGDPVPDIKYPIDKSCPDCGKMSLIRSA